ncbi:hypothetical protein AB1E19_020508 [Capra hircus]
MPGAFRTALSPGFAVGGSLQPEPDAPFCLWRLVVSERQAQQGAMQSHAKNRTCVRPSGSRGCAALWLRLFLTLPDICLAASGEEMRPSEQGGRIT